MNIHIHNNNTNSEITFIITNDILNLPDFGIGTLYIKLLNNKLEYEKLEYETITLNSKPEITKFLLEHNICMYPDKYLTFIKPLPSFKYNAKFEKPPIKRLSKTDIITYIKKWCLKNQLYFTKSKTTKSLYIYSTNKIDQHHQRIRVSDHTLPSYKPEVLVNIIISDDITETNNIDFVIPLLVRKNKIENIMNDALNTFKQKLANL